jgi:hypothetical protein
MLGFATREYGPVTFGALTTEKLPAVSLVEPVNINLTVVFAREMLVMTGGGGD